MAMKKKNLPVLKPQLFEHEQFGQIRFVTIDWEPWFVAADVCKVLDIQNVRQNLADFPDDEKGVCTVYTLGGPQKMNIISEPGLYRLIFMSRKPEAEKFKRWVTHEVLPSIRKYGYYVAPHQKLIEVKGRENLKALEEKYPAGAVEVKRILLDADENEYGELGSPYFRYEVAFHSNDLIATESSRKLVES